MRLVLCALIGILFFACSNSENLSLPQQGSSVDISEVSLSGMLRIKATGATAVLGTNSENVRANERPSMRVEFDYDFSLGMHETTCGEFDALMKPATGLALNCDQDDLPATNVTFFDAALFANERSKAEGFDTAYTYTSVSFDAEKHCTNLEGFAYRPDANAYRLPTEAEWILTASQNWILQNAWTAENSKYKLHPVCSKSDSVANACDMAGNAMEWVNDWLGKFVDTTLSNYVGAPDGGALGQRIVKGGSYRNAAETVNLFSRGDVYTVTSSTRADYVGFRLAFGNIPDALWMGNDGRANTSRIVPLANSSTIHSLVGTYKAKIAFRNDLSGNLAYIDYSRGVMSVVEIADTIDVYHPEISLDGKRVAFCTGLEGVSGESALYVRDLNAEGSNLVKLKVESAAVPRWRVLENGDTVIVYVTDAGNNKDDAAFAGTSTWQVKFADGKFGTPQKLFDGAYHGGISEDNTLAVTGARILRARIAKESSTIEKNARDTVWYKDGENAEQACNVSLAKDGSKRTLFLDFGGKTGQAFVGKSYVTHERLLIADSTGKLLQSVAAPAGYTFDHSEWASGASDKVVATLNNSNGLHQKIVLIDLTDSSLTELVSGDELWHPSFWVSEKSFLDGDVLLDLDSAGVYMHEGDDWGVALMRYNMELLWRYRDSVNVAVVGSSRPLYALLPSMMSEDFFMVNFAQTPNSIHMSRDFLNFYLFPHLKNLKYVLLSLDIDFWDKIDGEFGDNFFRNGYRKYSGYVYDKNHNYWKDGYPEGLLEYTESNFDVKPYLLVDVDRGATLQMFCGGWAERPPVEGDSLLKNSAALYKKSLESLENIIQNAQKRNITVIGILFPQNAGYRNTGAYGRYGMRRSVAEQYVSQFKEMQSLYPNFKLLDENKMGNHGYPSELFVDDDHLCIEGAKYFTAVVDSFLKTME